MRKSGLTGDEAYALSKRRGTSGDLGPLKKELSLLKEDISTNKADIATLNQGGLNLKEDFIGQQVNEWLDEHPEATTTVQDHSLTIDKMVVGTLGYVTPEMFGAISDGRSDNPTDNTVAFQNAINYCQENNVNLYIPVGVYLVNGTLTSNGRFKMYGAMSASTPRNSAVSNASIIYCTMDSEEPLLKFTNTNYSINIENLVILSNYANRDAIHLIHCGWNSLFRNVFISSFKGHAIYFDRQYDTVFENCSFIACCKYDGDNTKYSIKLDDIDSDTTNAIHFTNCLFEHSLHFVDLQKTRDCAFVNCKFESGDVSKEVNEEAQTHYSDGLPVIRIGANTFETIFSACMFMIQGMENFCFKDSGESLAKHLTNITINGCTFTSGIIKNAYGINLINTQYTRVLMSNCFASLLNPNNYSVNVKNSNISNCEFIIHAKDTTNFYGIKLNNSNLDNCRIGAHVDNGEYVATNVIPLMVTNESNVTNIKYFSPWLETFPFKQRYKMNNEFTYGKIGVENVAVKIGNDSVYESEESISLDLGKHYADTYIFNRSVNTIITNILNAPIGAQITILNISSSTVTINKGNDTYNGTTVYNNENIVLGTRCAVTLKKSDTQWYVI